jgi:hypothetical protein
MDALAQQLQLPLVNQQQASGVGGIHTLKVVKKRLNLDASLYTFLQILSVTLFEKMLLCQAVTGIEYKPNDAVQCNQLNLFAF